MLVGWGCCSQTKWRFRDQTKISTVKKTTTISPYETKHKRFRLLLSLSHCLHRCQPPWRLCWTCTPGHSPCRRRSWSTGCSCERPLLVPQSPVSPVKQSWMSPLHISTDFLFDERRWITHLCLLLQRQPFDGDEAVGFGVSDHHPPALLTFLWQMRHLLVKIMKILRNYTQKFKLSEGKTTS